MVFSLVAFASLTGRPIPGAITQASGRKLSWRGVMGDEQYDCLGRTALVVARVSKVGWALEKI